MTTFGKRHEHLTCKDHPGPSSLGDLLVIMDVFFFLDTNIVLPFCVEVVGWCRDALTSCHSPSSARNCWEVKSNFHKFPGNKCPPLVATTTTTSTTTTTTTINYLLTVSYSSPLPPTKQTFCSYPSHRFNSKIATPSDMMNGCSWAFSNSHSPWRHCGQQCLKQALHNDIYTLFIP